MSRIAIVLAGNIENLPYFRYYTDVLDKVKVTYEIITWDRLSLGPAGNHCFYYPSPYRISPVKKWFDFYKYSAFVKRILNSTHYDLIIVTTIVNTLFLGTFLIKKYLKQYIIDVRDYSPAVPLFEKKLKRICTNAKQVYISSPGWEKWLPRDINYILSHNVRMSDLLIESSAAYFNNKKQFRISTFGIIRDYKAQERIIDNLGHSDKFLLEYCGSGTEYLRNYALRRNINNVRIHGRYRKEDEADIIKRADMINILLPRTIAHDGAFSNRFYQALVYKKPVIVNEGNIQAEYVMKYHLGIVIKEDDNILERLLEYTSLYDSSVFELGCNEMIKIIKSDLMKFESSLIDLFPNKH